MRPEETVQATAQKPKESLPVTTLSVIGWVLAIISALVAAFALAEIIRALQSIEQQLRWRA